MYIANLMTQPGETLRYSAEDHLRALERHAGPKLFDQVVLNTGSLSPALQKRYARQRAEPVLADVAQLGALGVKPICAELLVEKDHVARHDSRALAQLLFDLAADQR